MTNVKKSGRGRRKAELGYFDRVDVENVCYVDEEDIYQHLRELNAVRDEGLKEGVDTTPVEIEICYLRRELASRQARHRAHEAYVRSLEEENAVLETAVVAATPAEAN